MVRRTTCYCTSEEDTELLFDTSYNDGNADFYFDPGSHCLHSCPAYASSWFTCGGDTDGIFVYNTGMKWAKKQHV